MELDDFPLWYRVGALAFGSVTFLVVWGTSTIATGALGFFVGWIPAFILAGIMGASWPLWITLLFAGGLYLLYSS